MFLIYNCHSISNHILYLNVFEVILWNFRLVFCILYGENVKNTTYGGGRVYQLYFQSMVISKIDLFYMRWDGIISMNFPVSKLGSFSKSCKIIEPYKVISFIWFQEWINRNGTGNFRFTLDDVLGAFKYKHWKYNFLPLASVIIWVCRVTLYYILFHCSSIW